VTERAVVGFITYVLTLLTVRKWNKHGIRINGTSIGEPT